MYDNGDSDDDTKKKVRGMLGDRAADLIDEDDDDSAKREKQA